MENKSVLKMADPDPVALALVKGVVPGFNGGMEQAALHPPANANQADLSSVQDHKAWLKAVAQGQDRAAFANLFAYYAPRIKSFLMKGGAAPDQADELAQETMLAVWQKAPAFDPAKANVSTWIFTIVRNKRIDALRKQIRPETDIADIETMADEAPSPVEDIDHQTETDVMAAALKTLPEEQSSLLYKSFFEDKTHADIAKETNIPLGTVKSRIRLALERLRGDQKVSALWP